MPANTMLENVKYALGITGTALDNTLTQYINEVESFLTESGVKAENITAGIVARGVADLWNYGGNEGKLSPYFIQRATQLALK